jgi:hypothetical protein
LYATVLSTFGVGTHLTSTIALLVKLSSKAGEPIPIEDMLPIIPVSEGAGEIFLKRLASFAHTLPDIFHVFARFRLDAVWRGVNKLRFCEKLERGSSTRAWYNSNGDVVNVYPLAFSAGDRIDEAVYMGFAQRHWALNMGTESKLRWAKKLVVPERNVIDRVDQKLRLGIVGYHNLIADFTQASEKLQVIHICNALIANSIKPAETKNIDIFTYPATADFCKGLKPYSLVPLVSAYLGTGALGQYDTGFAKYLMQGGKFNAAETSVESQLVRLFEEVTFENR